MSDSLSRGPAAPGRALAPAALALPAALMGLKQAFGRLMRRMDDWGVVAVLDGRLRSKGYGRWLLGGLPPHRHEAKH